MAFKAYIERIAMIDQHGVENHHLVMGLTERMPPGMFYYTAYYIRDGITIHGENGTSFKWKENTTAEKDLNMYRSTQIDAFELEEASLGHNVLFRVDHSNPLHLKSTEDILYDIIQKHWLDKRVPVIMNYINRRESTAYDKHGTATKVHYMTFYLFISLLQPF